MSKSNQIANMDDPRMLRAMHPEMYVPDANIDRHQCKRVVPMEVLSLGMSRTGTASMKQALQILGYHDVYHFYNIYENIADCDMWIEALTAKYEGKGKFGRAEFDKLLGHCMAVTDTPCAAVAPELIEAYPEAKVILVDRDVEAWNKSFQNVLEPIYRPDFRVAAFLDPFWMGKLYRMTVMWIEGQFGATSLEKGRANCRRVYEEHNDEVRRVTPRERLLEYELGSGWEPLCKFLGKEVPDMPFPNVNEADVLRSKMDVLGKKSMGRALRNVAGVILIGVVTGSLLYYIVA